MAKDTFEVTDSSTKPVATRPDVDMTKRSDAVSNNTSASDSAALVKTGVLPDTSISETPALSKDAISKDAQLLHDAITKSNFGVFSAPDVDAIKRILDPTNAKDRAAVEDAYTSEYGTKFRDDLRTYIGNDSVNYRTVEAMLNRVDGRTNFGGNLEVAMETMKQDPEKGNRLLRAAVGSLSSDQISQMAFDMQKAYAITPTDLVPANATEQQKKDFALGLDLATSGRTPATTQERAALNTYQKAFIDHVIEQTSGLSDTNRQVLEILTKGADQRTSADILQMASVAVDAKDLRMFADAVNSDTPAAIAARQQLASDQNFVAKYKSVFTDGASSTQQDIAADLLSEGKISLATIVKGDVNVFMGLLDNPENLDLAASNSSAKERQDFSIGKELSLSGTAPANAEQTAALAYYDKINQAMISVNMDSKQRAIVEDELQHGGKTLISRLVEMNKPGILGTSILGGYTSQDLLSGVENMSQTDYNLLHNDPTYKDDVLKGLYSIGANEDLIPRLTKLLQDKASAPTFEDSQSVKRTVLEVYQDTLSGGASQQNLANAIATMSPADAAMYKNNADYQKKIDEIVQSNNNDTVKYLATSVLEQVAQTGTSPVLNPLQQIAQGVMNNATDLQQLPLVQKFLQDPEVRASLNRPDAELTDADKTARAILGEAMHYHVDLKTLVTNGDASVAEKQGMGVPLNELYSDVAKLPQDQRDVFTSLNMDDSQLEVLNQVIAQGGEVKLEDKVRAIIVDSDSNESYKDLKAEFEKLTTNEEKEALIQAYQNKYHSNLSNDLMPLVDAADKSQYQGFLAPNGDGNQTYFDHVTQTDGKLSWAFDATALETQRALDQNKDLLTQYQALKQQLPIEIQKQISQLISTAAAENQAAPIEEIKKLGKTAVELAAVAASIYTLGGSLALLGADAAVTGADLALAGADVGLSTSTEVAASTATSAITDGVFFEAPQQLLLAAPVSSELSAAVGAGTTGTAELTAATTELSVAPELSAATAELSVAPELSATTTEISTATNPAISTVTTPEISTVATPEISTATTPTISTATTPEISTAEVSSAPAGPVSTAPASTSSTTAVDDTSALITRQPTAFPVPDQPIEALASAPRAPFAVDMANASVTTDADGSLIITKLPAEGDSMAAESGSVTPSESSSDAIVESKATPDPVVTSSNQSTTLVPYSGDGSVVTDGVESGAANTAENAMVANVTDNATAIKLADSSADTELVSSTGVPTLPLLPVLAAAPVVGAEALDTQAKPEAPVANTTDFTPPTVPNDKIIDLATVRVGEGPFMSAERILAAASGKRPDIKEVKELTAVLKKYFSPERNGNKSMDGLKVKYQFITKENFADIVAEVADPAVQAQLMQFAMAS